MIKQKAVLEMKMGERCYQLECYADSPLGELHDVLVHMKHFIIQKMEEAEKTKDSASSIPTQEQV